MVHGLLPGARLTNSQREGIDWWAAGEVSTNLRQELNKVLPRGESWTEQLEVFGDLEATCITILKEGGVVTNVDARLDLRTLTAQAGKAVLDFARELDCLLMTNRNDLINPDSADLVEAIRTSGAYQFVKDPRGFLSEGVSPRNEESA